MGLHSSASPVPMQGSRAEFFSECCLNSLFSNTTKNLYFKDFLSNSGLKYYVCIFITTCFRTRQKCESAFYLVVIVVVSIPRPSIKFSSASATGHEWSLDSGA